MTKVKIETITPVHIGTGDTKLPIFYMEDGEYMSFYDEQEVLSCVPDKILLDKQFLDKLSHFSDKGARSGQSPSKYLQNTLKRYVDFSKLSPRYQLKSDVDYYITENKKYNEQIKTLDKPYIPGSSLKGAILNAVYYSFLLFKGKELSYKLSHIEKLSLESIMEALGISGDFIKKFNSCLTVRDVPFNELRVMDAKRLDTRDEKKDLSDALPLFECIDYGQDTTDSYILINQEKLNLIKGEDNDSEACKQLKNCLNYKMIRLACNRYMLDILNEELNLDDNLDFYSKNNLRNALEGLKKNVANKENNAFYLRIGSSTNYFSKTVSLLFKNKFPHEYDKRFNQSFSPSNRKNTRAKSDTLPKTRMLYLDEQVGNCYPGVIRIEYVD